MRCQDCNEDLTALNPPIEDYTDNRFCINIFGYKLLLVKDTIEYGCTKCITDKESGNRSDIYHAIKSEGYAEGYKDARRDYKIDY